MNCKVVVKPYTLDLETGKAVPGGIYTLIQCYEEWVIICKKVGETYKVSTNRIYRVDQKDGD